MAFRSRRIGATSKNRPPAQQAPGDDEFLDQFRENPPARQQPPPRPRYEQGMPSAQSRYARGSLAQTENYPREEYYQQDIRPATSKYARVQPQQPQLAMKDVPPTRRTKGSASGVGGQLSEELAETVASLKATVSEWEKVWDEMSDSVFDMVCDVKVNNLPFYKTLPTNEEDLGSPQSTRLQRGQSIVVVYPQYKRAGLLFMRMRKINHNTGAIKSYFVPIKNFSDTNNDVLAELAGINTTTKDFVGNFRLPGETATKPAAE
jgi:hypothetical protein